MRRQRVINPNDYEPILCPTCLNNGKNGLMKVHVIETCRGPEPRYVCNEGCVLCLDVFNIPENLKRQSFKIEYAQTTQATSTSKTVETSIKVSSQNSNSPQQ